MTVSDDHRRMAVLAGIDIDHPDLRAKLDEISERTAARLGQPVGLVSMVLDEAQFFPGSYGLRGWLDELRGTPIEWSFCVNTVRSGQPYVVGDTRDAHADNPLVAIDGLHTYAGVPIVVDGEVLGAHCVLGYAASDFSSDDVEVLRAGASEIAELLNLYRARTSNG